MLTVPGFKSRFQPPRVEILSWIIVVLAPVVGFLPFMYETWVPLTGPGCGPSVLT